jgi:hypothetical protein
MSGGKGGSQTSRVEIPQWIEQPTIRNLARAEQVARMGYQPYYGPEVAAFTPMQQQAMQSQYDAASAFGMAPMGGDAMAGMPTPTEYAGGVMGYGSGDIFDQSVNEFQKRQPDQAAIYNQQFVGPDTGNYDFYAPGKQNPIMGSGGGKGGSIPTGNIGAPDNTNVNIPELRGIGAGYDGFGGTGGFGQSIPTMPTDMPGMPGVPGPFVAQGIGSQIPGSPMVGGGSSGPSGSPDPFDPFTTGRGGITGTPVDFPEGQPVAPDSNDLMMYNQMPDFSMPQVGMNMPSPGMDFNVPPAPSFSAPSVGMSQPVSDFSAPIAPINLPMPDFSAPVADFSAPQVNMGALDFNFEPAPMPQPSFDMNMQNPMMGFNAPAAPSMMPFNAPEFNQSQFGQPPAMQAQLPIRAADFGQMQFGRPAGLFGMMGA